MTILVKRWCAIWGVVFSTLCFDVAHASPKIQHWTTGKGLAVYFVAVPNLPMLDMRLTFRAGSSKDADQPGLAMMTVSMLDEGTQDKDVDAIAREFADVGGRFGASSARDMAYVSLRTLTLAEPFEQATSMYLEILSEASFPEERLDNIKQRVLTSLKAQEQSPDSVASRQWMQALYPEHPYGSNSRGEVDSITAMTREDLQRFKQQYFVNQNAVLALVGNLNTEQAKALAERVSNALPEGEKAAPPPMPELVDTQNLQESFPSEQTHLWLGQLGIPQNHRDQLALQIGNQILGRGSTSRLYQNIRKDRGLSYSVYSFFSPMERSGPFGINLQTKTDQADEALSVVTQTVKQFLKDGPTQDEVERTIKEVTGGFPLATASNSDILREISYIGFYDLPLDHLQTYPERVRALTREQIHQAMKRHIKPDDWIVLQLGRSMTAE